MRIKISLQKLIIVSLLFVIGCVSLAYGADPGVTLPTTESGGWFANHWAGLALVISEVAAFLPSKASGILQGIVAGVSAVFSALKQKN